MSSARDWGERTERRKIEEVSLSSGTVRRRRTGRQYYSRVRIIPQRVSLALLYLPLPSPALSLRRWRACIYARAAAVCLPYHGAARECHSFSPRKCKTRLACHFERRRGETDNTTHTCVCAVVVSRSSANAQLSLVRHIASDTHGVAPARWTQAVFVLRKRPSARRGPGIVSVDRNVRSNCRCSCVLQFTR